LGCEKPSDNSALAVLLSQIKVLTPQKQYYRKEKGKATNGLIATL